MSTQISRRHIIIHFISISLMNAAKYHLPKSVISQWNSSGESEIEFFSLAARHGFSEREPRLVEEGGLIMSLNVINC